MEDSDLKNHGEATSANAEREEAQDGNALRAAAAGAPVFGASCELAPGVWWATLPISNSVGHVNVYLLESAEGWTLVDTGTNSTDCRQTLMDLLHSDPFRNRPLTQVIVTHFHPDHLGLAGELTSQGAPLVTSRTTWMLARMLQLDSRPVPFPEYLAMAVRAGVRGQELEFYQRRPPAPFRTSVATLPPTYTRLVDGQTLTIGTRHWRIVMTDGHAPEHVTLWSDDGLALVGDQLLWGMSSNLSVLPSEADADVAADWLASCETICELADDNTICLAGHQLPFLGMHARCRQVRAAHRGVLNRLLEHMKRPRTTRDCLDAMYGRVPHPTELGHMIAEATAFLNHLLGQGQVRRTMAADQSYVWQQVPGVTDSGSSTTVSIRHAGPYKMERRPR